MKKQMLPVLVMSSILLNVFNPAMAQQPPQNSRAPKILADDKIQEIFNRRRDIYELVKEHLATPHKQGLDRNLWDFVHSNPVLEAIFQKVEKQSEQEVDQQTIEYYLSAALAVPATGTSKGQYSRAYEIAQKVARLKNFSEADVQKIQVFVINSPEINAFTYSTSAGKGLYVVIYKGLLDQMTDDQMIAVLGHEFTHIENKHVVLGEFAETFYKLSGKEAFRVPSEDSITPQAIKIARMTFSKHIKGFGRALSDSQQDQLVRKIALRIDKVSYSVAGYLLQQIEIGKIAKKALTQMAQDFFNEVDAEADIKDNLILQKLLADKTKTKAQKAAALHEFRMTKLTYSQEKTADTGSWSREEIGLDMFNSALSLLVGGPDVNPEIFVKQSQMVLAQYSIAQLHAMGIDLDDHPTLGVRVEEAGRLSKTLPFIMTATDFLENFYLAQKLSEDIAKTQSLIETFRSPKKIKTARHALKDLRDLRLRISQQINGLLMNEIKNYDVNNPNSLKNFKSILMAIATLAQASEDLEKGKVKDVKVAQRSLSDFASPMAADLADSQGVYNHINAMLLANSNNPLAKAMHEGLNKMVELKSPRHVSDRMMVDGDDSISHLTTSQAQVIQCKDVYAH